MQEEVFTTEVGRLLHRADFLVSCSDAKQYPVDVGYEVAFVGRSNSGKSSAINTITQKKKLAFSSKTPGRTQLINFFDLGSDKRLVDLPGYGFASASVRTQKAWSKNLQTYFSTRESLVGLVWLMDIRHPMQPHDQIMLEWVTSLDIPVQLMLSKADKLTRNKASQAVHKMRQTLGPDHIELGIQSFSSLKKQGLDALFDKFALWFGMANT